MGAGLPSINVYIGTAVDSDNFTLDDATKGKLDTGGTLSAPLGYTLSDITDSVRDGDGVTISRGGSRNQGPYFRAEAGTCSFTLDNRDGDFDPLNLSGTWVSGGVSQLRPGLVVVVTPTLNSVEGDPLFVGTVQSWNVSYPMKGSDSVAKVVCGDAISELAAADLYAQPVQGSLENVGARLNRILDNIGWGSQWRIIDDDGTETLQSTVMAQPAWTEMLLSSDSANGYLFVNRHGWIVYKTKSRFPRVSDAYFADSGIPVDSLEVSTDAAQIYNYVKMGRKDGNVQAFRDVTSEALYGTRSYGRTDLVVSTDSQVSESADHILSQFRDLHRRVESIRVTAAQDTETMDWQTLLSLDLLQRVSSTFSTTDGRTVVMESLVRGISLTVRPFVWDWTISTSQAPNVFGDFTLDSVSLGILDTNTLVSF